MPLTLFQQATRTLAAGAPAARSVSSSGKMVRYFFKLGLLGLFFISAIDSSPIPLPIPGSSDILLVLIAAQRHAWLVATLIATLGSVAGAAASYQAGVAGGLPLIDRYVPARFRDRMKEWSREHALLSVALPAVLPPPAPLMPFLIAAGALKMPRGRFYLSFTVSRFARHAFFAWLGVHYGRRIMPIYLRFADRYGWILLVIVWGSIVFGLIYAVIQLRKRGKKASATPAGATAKA